MNIHNNSLNGGNNNVIIRIPSKNEYINILQNSDLNGTIDITSSKSNVWNFDYSGITLDFSILQDNSAYSFNIPAAVIDLTSGGYLPSYYTMCKSNKDNVYYSWNNSSGFTVPCFRPIFEFNQE